MRSSRCPKTFVTKHPFMLRNVTAQRRLQIHCGISIISCILLLLLLLLLLLVIRFLIILGVCSCPCSRYIRKERGIECLSCSKCVTSCGHFEPSSHRNLTVAGSSTDFPRQPVRVWSGVRHSALSIQNHRSIWEKSKLFQALAQESYCIQDTLILQIT
jgi:hypothetical protein